MIYKYCRRCGRRLEGEENRQRGYGETCFRKAQAESRRHPLIVPIGKQTEQGTKWEQSKADGKTDSTEQTTPKGKAVAKQGRADHRGQSPKQSQVENKIERQE